MYLIPTRCKVVRRLLTCTVGALSLVVLANSCANPADNKPVAETSAPIEKEITPIETPAQAANGSVYTIASGSKLMWTGSKVTGSHDGGFNTFSGQVTLPADDLTQAAIKIDMDVNSMYSDNDKLTEHLKSPDFFDAPSFPTATFESTSLAKTATGYDVSGNLTLRGVTKGIIFPASLAMEGDTLKANAEFVINRKDFNINYAGKADDLIRDEVVIKFDITATKS
ncbi:MAG: hypothetical protein AMXMBFR84_47750 [Candidatus Hydrogenedentota bacterium]